MRIALELGPRWGLGFEAFGKYGRTWLTVFGKRFTGRQFHLTPLLVALDLFILAFALHAWFGPANTACMAGQPDLAPGKPAPPPYYSLAVPDTPALGFGEYEVGERESLAQIAYADKVSVACLEALNPGVAVEPGARLVIPKPGCEVVVYRAHGGESLSDLADFWSRERVAHYLGVGGSQDMAAKVLMRARDMTAVLVTQDPCRTVTVERLAADNAIPPTQPLAPGQVVYIQVAAPASEVEVKYRDGSRNYIGCNLGLPVAGRFSQSYGGVSGKHGAIDISAPLGTQITCPRDGVVLFLGVDDREKATLGNHVHLVHRWSPEALAYMLATFGTDDYAALPDGARREFIAHVEAMRERGVRISSLETVYGHVTEGAFGVGKGSIVRAGQKLATVGDNGHSTGPHVHWAVLVDEVPLPPLWFVAGVEGQG